MPLYVWEDCGKERDAFHGRTSRRGVIIRKTSGYFYLLDFPCRLADSADDVSVVTQSLLLDLQSRQVILCLRDQLPCELQL